MELKDFKEKAKLLIDEFQELIETMPQKGNTTNECQRLTMQQRLNELEHAVSGTQAEDLMENDTYCDVCCHEFVKADRKTCPECGSDDLLEL